MALYESEGNLRSESIRSLHRWWQANARTNIPDRADFNPAEFKDLLPYLLISNVEHDPFRVRYRLVGTRVVEATGIDITGRYLDELIPVEPDEPWMGEYELAYRRRRPVLGTSTAKTRSGLRFVYEFGIFPLRKGGTSVEQFVAIEDYFDFSDLQELPGWQVKVASLA